MIINASHQNIRVPIFSQTHSGSAAAFMAGDYYTKTTYLDIYQNILFFMDMRRETINALFSDATGAAPQIFTTLT
jgi:hypothetical protein